MSPLFPITRKQREAVRDVWLRDIAAKISNVKTTGQSQTLHGYRHYRRRVNPTFGCDGAVSINVWNMWLCIERDGYTHS